MQVGDAVAMVLPNSVENKWLAALRENGEILYSEAEIVELRSNVLIEAIYLLDRSLDRARGGGRPEGRARHERVVDHA